MAIVSDFKALLSGYYWSVPFGAAPGARPTFLTYSFSTAAPDYVVNASAAGAQTFSPLTAAERSVIKTALSAWESISGVKFIETTQNPGDLVFGFYKLDLFGSAGAAGVGGYPQPGAFTAVDGQLGVYGASNDYSGGDVKFDIGYRSNALFPTDFLHVALHEIGHALGLKHPFDGDPTLTAALHVGSNTVMSYDNVTRATMLGPMDIAAAQLIYGPSTADGTQDASWSWNPTTETLTQVGTGAAEFIRGTSANDIIFSMGGRDAIVTDQGNDRVVLTGQVASVNGGTGVDTVVTGLSYAASLVMGGDNASEFHWISIGADFMTFVQVERLEFTNLTIAFDIGNNQHAGEAYRVYQAAFNRVPDQAGLGYWIREIDAGKGDLAWLANNFIISHEFKATYGSPSTVSDSQFITLLYNNVLHRAPDASGLSYWQSQIAQGFVRERVLASFSESVENQQNVIGVIQDGIFYT